MWASRKFKRRCHTLQEDRLLTGGSTSRARNGAGSAVSLALISFSCWDLVAFNSARRSSTCRLRSSVSLLDVAAVSCHLRSSSLKSIFSHFKISTESWSCAYLVLVSAHSFRYLSRSLRSRVFMSNPSEPSFGNCDAGPGMALFMAGAERRGYFDHW